MVASPPPGRPRLWQNQPIALYHGTMQRHAITIIEGGIDLSRSQEFRDFGRGFYTTSSVEQARAWGRVLHAEIANATERDAAENQPAVVRFDVNRDRLAQLEFLAFVRYDSDYDDLWNLIGDCRGYGVRHGRGDDDL